ncbi:MAG: Methionine aminopeptidase [Candidatus Pacebacteria bacterium GW2011_GWF2_38_9]|nr:MAG: methionine aminopeptidase, methionyl aminopeptidase [candidate division TM6 bacterium GW2011_GWF2_28_16]KKQ10288.1 MAG: Methionine aminopeptidase [Candidatus Pacebacteria bacterium GW2011_GWF1_36_5]KKQ88651.1 MAG: Methionine aminopeptidase [Candidatus Pacebacteria bacterium GW2011_GWF2_38_9]HAZ73701.1 type I methionyl aminopeptidase [Candidatus Paceibacterota bacterium]
MTINSDHQLIKYQEIGKKSTEMLWQLWEATIEGATPAQIDDLATRLCQRYNVTSAFKGVGSRKNPYRYVTCINVNDGVVHGIPSTIPLQKGDIVKVDFGIIDEGFYTDHCFTKSIGEPSEEDLLLMKTARRAVQEAARKAIVGNKVGDLGFTMQSVAEKVGFSTVKEFVGHGIGFTMHDEPQIPAWGKIRQGLTLERGQVLCVEAQVIASKDDGVYMDEDGWTIRSESGAKAAMFEYMVVVQEKKPVFLTPTLQWPLY